MRIYLFRHGETDWNKERRLQGRSDVPLNAFGRELAVKTAEALKGVAFDAAFSSPLCRAMETAQILLGVAGPELVTDQRLMEMCFGNFEGDYFDHAKQQDSCHPLHDFFCQPERYIPPMGAESFQEAMTRGSSFLQEKILPLEGRCENVLVLAHGALNRCILSAIGEIPLDRFWQLGLPNCAASILSLENGRFRIEEASRVYYEGQVNARP